MSSDSISIRICSLCHALRGGDPLRNWFRQANDNGTGTVPATGEQPDDVNITHRTQSIDFGIVLKGTIKMILDDGSETIFKEGDVCVQRGTDHVSCCVCPSLSRFFLARFTLSHHGSQLRGGKADWVLSFRPGKT